MVAYSFKPRFAEPILAGTKAQTIRGERKRHARPGEQLQLYTDMRTRQCRLIARAECRSVQPVRLIFDRSRGAMSFLVDSVWLERDAMELFAQSDGFVADSTPAIRDMADFWFEHHGRKLDEIDFRGFVITWQPLGAAGAP